MRPITFLILSLGAVYFCGSNAYVQKGKCKFINISTARDESALSLQCDIYGNDLLDEVMRLTTKMDEFNSSVGSFDEFASEIVEIKVNAFGKMLILPDMRSCCPSMANFAIWRMSYTNSLIMSPDQFNNTMNLTYLAMFGFNITDDSVQTGLSIKEFNLRNLPNRYSKTGIKILNQLQEFTTSRSFALQDDTSSDILPTSVVFNESAASLESIEICDIESPVISKDLFRGMSKLKRLLFSIDVEVIEATSFDELTNLEEFEYCFATCVRIPFRMACSRTREN